jgi:hypothetical protein
LLLSKASTMSHRTSELGKINENIHKAIQ